VTLTQVRGEPIPAVYAFNRTTEPVSAEQRQTFRVSVALADIFAQLGSQRRCQVADISPEGMAIIGSPGLSIGSVQHIGFAYENFRIDADACVQTIKVLATGKVRYGLLIPRSNATARNTLQRLSVALQRTQLRRLAGAA
jgi:c-di-GMP-binding flagellar brake protein YcgR